MSKNKKEMVDYWKIMAEKDFTFAKDLFDLKKYSWSLFFTHLSIERVLKGIYVMRTGEPAPYFHDLAKLARKDNLGLDQQEEEILAEISTFNISARYDDYKFRFYKKATKEFTDHWLKEGTKMYNKLLNILKNS